MVEKRQSDNNYRVWTRFKRIAEDDQNNVGKLFKLCLS